MDIATTTIEGCFEIVPDIIKDERGHFFESYHQRKFETAIGASPVFVQDNQSFSTRGVLRGLHFQKGRHAQAKLVRTVHGKVLDVAIDIRPGSTTYGKVFRSILSADNKKQVYVPRGCAHGFVVLSETAVFAYKCDNFYHRASEGGIRYNDPALGIDWMIDGNELIVSEKDRALPALGEIETDLTFSNR